MLLKLSPEISECYCRAARARQLAEDTNDPAIKEDFLEMERRWMFLAHSYEFTARLSDFTQFIHTRKSK